MIYLSTGAAEVFLCATTPSNPRIAFIKQCENTADAMYLADSLNEAYDLGRKSIVKDINVLLKTN